MFKNALHRLAAAPWTRLHNDTATSPFALFNSMPHGFGKKGNCFALNDSFCLALFFHLSRFVLFRVCAFYARNGVDVRVF